MKSRFTLGAIALTLLLASCGQESAESTTSKAGKGSVLSGQHQSAQNKYKAPVADFGFDGDGLKMKFFDKSTADGSITKWDWDFGNGYDDEIANPELNYRGPGTFNVKLTVTDNNGKTGTKVRKIKIKTSGKPEEVGGDPAPGNKAPVADFSFDGDGLKMKFFDKSTDADGTIAKWAWDFGNGYDDEIANPELNYRGPGTFNVKLTVTDNGGKTGTKVRKIKIKTNGKPEEVGGTPENKAPVSKFNFSKKGLSVNFSDKSTDADGQVTKWAWDFGDNQSSSEKNPAHTYASAGTYTVKLTVTDNNGATNTSQKTVTVKKVDPNNQTPVADFSFDGNGLEMKFTDKSTDTDGKVTKWDWDFGNGYDADVANPELNYRGPGTFSVRLTVTDDGGATSSKTRRIKIRNSGKPSEVQPGENIEPTAYFTYEANGLDVSFKEGSYDTDGNIIKWIWDFGNGKTSDKRNPSIKYDKKGNYKVKLTVTDNKNATNSFENTVKVSDKPKPSVKAAFTYTKNSLQVSFKDASTGNPNSWAWDFGNGETSDQQNPVVNYRAKGTYTVKLTVTNSAGQSDTTQQSIEVSKSGGGGGNKAPNAQFTYTKNGLRVTLQDESTDPDGQVTQWAWDFGNGETSDQQNPAVNYRAKGTYTVKLTVTDNQGATNTTQQSVEVSKGGGGGGGNPNPNPDKGVFKGTIPAGGAFYAPNEQGFQHSGGQLSATIAKPNGTVVFQLQQYRYGQWITRKTDSGSSSISHNAEAGTYRWTARSYGAGGDVTITIGGSKR